MRFIPILAIAVVVLQGCAHHQPVWAQGSLIRISGKTSQNLSPDETTRQMLGRAARATVDHGHRYFVLVNVPAGGKLQPGANLDIRMLDDNRGGAFDAYALLEGAKAAS